MIAMPGPPKNDRAPSAGHGAASWIKSSWVKSSWIKWLTAIWRHRRDVEILASFNDHMLADIGLTRADLRDASAESRWHDPAAHLIARRPEHRENRCGNSFRLASQNAGTTSVGARGDVGALAPSAVLTW
jgi:uncharacterized protein YjiS (DUF1127 family)